MYAKLIQAAVERLQKNPGLHFQIAQEIQATANRVRQTHPIGYAAIDAQLANGMLGASRLTGAEQLVALDELKADFAARDVEAAAGVEQARKVAYDMAAARSLQIRTGGGVPHRDPALLEAIRVVKLRLDALAHGGGHESEGDFIDRLAQMESAVKSFSSSVGLAKRESRLRIAAIRAAAAVEAADMAEAA